MSDVRTALVTGVSGRVADAMAARRTFEQTLRALVELAAAAAARVVR